MRCSLAALLALLAIAGAPARGDEVAPPAAKPSPRSNAAPAKLRRSVGDALRRQATAPAEEQASALKALTAQYRALEADASLPENERQQLQTIVRNRLDRQAAKLKRQAARKPAGKAANPAQAVAGAAGRGQGPAASPGRTSGAAGADGADELLDLIENTIRPSSWESRGGRGTMRYFSPRQLLVVRQTDEVHEQIDAALDRLRTP